MRAPCSLAEAVLIVGLCLFAIGSARAVDSAHQEEQAGRDAMNRLAAAVSGCTKVTTMPSATVCRTVRMLDQPE